MASVSLLSISPSTLDRFCDVDVSWESCQAVQRFEEVAEDVATGALLADLGKKLRSASNLIQEMCALKVWRAFGVDAGSYSAHFQRAEFMIESACKAQRALESYVSDPGDNLNSRLLTPEWLARCDRHEDWAFRLLMKEMLVPASCVRRDVPIALVHCPTNNGRELEGVLSTLEIGLFPSKRGVTGFGRHPADVVRTTGRFSGSHPQCAREFTDSVLAAWDKARDATRPAGQSRGWDGYWRLADAHSKIEKVDGNSAGGAAVRALLGAMHERHLSPAVLVLTGLSANGFGPVEHIIEKVTTAVGDGTIDTLVLSPSNEPEAMVAIRRTSRPGDWTRDDSQRGWVVLRRATARLA